MLFDRQLQAHFYLLKHLTGNCRHTSIAVEAFLLNNKPKFWVVTAKPDLFFITIFTFAYSILPWNTYVRTNFYIWIWSNAAILKLDCRSTDGSTKWNWNACVIVWLRDVTIDQNCDLCMHNSHLVLFLVNCSMNNDVPRNVMIHNSNLN